MAESANKYGRKLVGVGGLTCIACHQFAGNKSLGIPALDLASTGGRLNGNGSGVISSIHPPFARERACRLSGRMESR
jgi:hypothetical protein